MSSSPDPLPLPLLLLAPGRLSPALDPPAAAAAMSAATPTPRFASPPRKTHDLPAESFSAPHGYAFPQDRLHRRLRHANKTPLVLVACGSFSPITELHLQLFELADKCVERTGFEIVGNYMSPCSDQYGKAHLAPAHDRIKM